MFFAIIGKNRALSESELQLVHPKNLKISGDTATFETTQPDRLSQLAGTIKRGQIFPRTQLETKLAGAKLIGCDHLADAKKRKKSLGAKRFKLCPRTHSDRDLKKSGHELIRLGDDQRGLVSASQNIELFEKIEFQKPARDMKIGMMPAKLAGLMTNIARAHTKNPNFLLGDPFAGLGTIPLRASAQQLDCLASDLEISPLQKNLARAQQQPQLFPGKITIEQHDATTKFWPTRSQITTIASETRLGPIIRGHSSDHAVADAQTQISQLLTKFFDQISKLPQLETMILCIAHHTHSPNAHHAEIFSHAHRHGRSHKLLEIYARAGQRVNRAIVHFSRA